MAWVGNPATVKIGEKYGGDDSAGHGDDLNVEVRDRFEALGQHKHTGAPGDGSADMGPLAMVTMTDAAAPNAPGAGKTVIYTRAGRLRYRAGAAGSEQTPSLATHTH